MNIYDISEKAGVSIATVSRVINGTNNVKGSTRDKVLKIIEECGYTPNAFARGLGHNTMNTIGIMCADSSDPFIAKAIYFLEKSLRENHYDVLLCCTGYELSDKKKYLNLLLSKRTDAIIMVGSNYVEANDELNTYIRNAAKKVPIMLLNGVLNGSNIYSTACDDYYATYDAVKALIKSDSKRIMYLYNAMSYSGNHKLSGFNDSCIDTLIDKNSYSSHFIDGGISETLTYLTNLHEKGTQFDAIITSDDLLAIGALKYANQYNISVPKQLSIVGYNNSIIATCSEPELTSIDNNVDALCTACITNLMNIFKKASVPSKTVYPARIIQRGTTAFIQ